MFQYIQRKIGAKDNASTTLDRPLKQAQKKITDRAQLEGKPATSIAALITQNPNTLAQYAKYLRERSVPVTDGTPEALARAVYAEMQKEYYNHALNVLASNPELHTPFEVNNPWEVSKQIAFSTYDMDAAEYDHCQKNNMLQFTNTLTPAAIVSADLIGTSQPDNFDDEDECGCKKKFFDSFDTNDNSGNIGGYPGADPNATKGNPPIAAGSGGSLVKEWKGYQIYSDGTVKKNGAEINIWDDFSMSDLCALGDMVDISAKLGDNAKYYKIACGAASAWNYIKGPCGTFFQYLLGNTTDENKNFDNLEGFTQKNIDVNRLGQLERQWRKWVTGSESGSNYFQNPLDYYPLNVAIYSENVTKGDNTIVESREKTKLFGNVKAAHDEIFRVMKILNANFWDIPAWAKYKAFGTIPLAAEKMYNESYGAVKTEMKQIFPSWSSMYADGNYSIEKGNETRIGEIFKPRYSAPLIDKAKKETGENSSLPESNTKPLEGAILWVGGQENERATGFFTNVPGIAGSLAAGDLVDITVFTGSKKYEGRRKVKYIGDDAGGNKWNMFTIDVPTDRTGGATVATTGVFKKVITEEKKDENGAKTGFIYLLIRFLGWDRKGLFN